VKLPKDVMDQLFLPNGLSELIAPASVLQRLSERPLANQTAKAEGIVLSQPNKQLTQSGGGR
jgi:hypothetical protein